MELEFELKREREIERGRERETHHITMNAVVD